MSHSIAAIQAAQMMQSQFGIQAKKGATEEEKDSSRLAQLAKQIGPDVLVDLHGKTQRGVYPTAQAAQAAKQRMIAHDEQREEDESSNYDDGGYDSSYEGEGSDGGEQDAKGEHDHKTAEQEPQMRTHLDDRSY